MRYIKERFFIIRSAILLTVLLTLSIFAPDFVFAEEPGGTATNTSSVSYVERSWDESTKSVVSKNKTRDNVQPVPSDGNMKSGWYYLDRNITKNGRIESITGNVNLILGDGYTLDVKGLYVPSGWTLTIYGQSKGTGKIYSHPSGGAGIGGYSKHDNGKIIIHGGTIDAKGYDHCAGIGSNDDCTGDAIFIYGGTIKATGGNDGAGIGGGEDCNSGTIRIYGGDLDVTAGNNAAGIGGGENGDGEYITIYGGNIQVKSRDGAAIGGAEDGDGGHTTISGGTLHLDSGNGAGIGGGNKAGDGGHITITGGDITIHAEHGAGIGGGRAPSSAFGSNSGDGGTIRISGNTTKINITSEEGYCIGAGNASTAKGYGSGGFIGSGGNVRIDGGELTLKGNYSHACFGGDSGHFEMYGGIVNGDHPQETPDYLFWYIGNAEVEIYGGKLSGAPVRMKDDDYYGDDEKMHPCSIFKMTGGELNIRNPYTQRNGVEANQITLSDDIMVKKSKTSEAGEAKDPVPAAERVSTAKSKDNYYVTLKTCDHPNAKYSVHGATSHSPLCDYCKKHILDEPHVWDGETGRCTKCGYQANDLTVTFDSDNGEEAFVVSVPKGNKVTRPGDPIKRGFAFTGWKKVISPLVEEDFDFNTPITENIKLKAKWENRWSELQTIIDNTPDGGTIKLGCDYTAASGDTALVIPEGTTITIDLNGFAIDRAYPDMKGVLDSSAIIVESGANLTVKDSGEDGMITGGSCGGVYVKGDSFTLEGGNIIDNKNEDFGGGVVLANGTFNMTGGSITENSTDGEDGGDGGGVYMSSGTTFNMSGGRIKGNSCSGKGGGVYMPESSVSRMSTFNMTGGVINGNSCNGFGGGVYVSRNCMLNLSGNLSITGNTLLENNKDLKDSDVYLPNTQRKINVIDDLAETARIGVSVMSDSYTGSGNPFTRDLSGRGTEENFLSNNDQYLVLVNNSKDAYLIKAEEIITVTFDRNDGSEEEEWSVTVKKGERAEEPETPSREGYDFEGWYQLISTGPEVLADEAFDFNTPITNDITLKAIWEETETEWDDPVYTWSEDNSSVTAKRTSKSDPAVTEEEEVGATEEIKKEPTCTEQGETVYTSAEFSNTAFEVQTKTVISDSLGHTPSDEFKKENVIEPTCTEAGSFDRVTVCKRCEAEMARVHETTAPLGHDYKEVEGSAATCTENGKEADLKCSRCESEIEGAVIPALGHDWSEWEVTKEASETEEGEERRICKRCDETETREIPKTDHVHHVTKFDENEASCEEAGNIEYYVCEDDQCGRCFAEDDTGTVTIYYGGTGINAREINAEDTIIPAAGHNWDEGVVILEPACTLDGIMKYTCTVCGAEREEIIEKHLHDTETVKDVITEPECEKSGYHWDVTRCKICGEGMTMRLVRDDALGHDWSEWKVTKNATTDEEGEESRSCSRCGEAEYHVIPPVDPMPAPGTDPDQKGNDGTPVGPGASEASADIAITSDTTDEGPAGTRYAPLRLQSKKQAKTSIKLTWANLNGAAEYVVYGALSGKSNRMTRLASIGTNTMTVKDIGGVKLKKGKYYKFIVVALDSNKTVISTSKVAHVATKGGKVGNHKKVTVKKSAVSKAKKLKAGKTLKLKAKAVKAGKKVKKRRAVSYESTDPGIATVSRKGVVKGVQKGTCYIYAYAQNGVAKKIKVVIK